MDQLQAIRSFARVVEAGSFTRAAESLDIPKATLSKQIQDLEIYLGIRLLQRTTRRVTVTAEGQEYYEKTLRICADLEDIDTSFGSVLNTPQGKLRIDVGSSTASDLLIPALPDFISRYPEIKLELGVTDRAVDLISNNVDCVIRGGDLDNSSLVARSIGNATMVTCATPQYLKHFGIPAYPEELQNGHRLVGYVISQNGRTVPFKFMKDGIIQEIKTEHFIGINESNAHLAAGLAGLGIIQTFAYTTKKAINEGSLVEILKEWRPHAYPFHVVYPQNRHITRRLRVFIDWLVEVFPQKLI
nr:LysR family transcriptional regulator [uncultured Tolumonas sp.]